MKLNKLFALVLSIALLTTSVFGPGAIAEEKKLSVITTIFPVYDWVREVVGDNENIEITMLLDSGVDLHSYQPTAEDIMKIATCDMFIYIGGESDEWVEDALEEAVNPNMTAIKLLEALGDGLKTEELVEGMEHDHGEDNDHEHDAEYDHDHEEEADEHIWLSLRNAQKLVRAIADAVGKTDPAHADVYCSNADIYIEKLAELDAQFVAVTENAAYRTVLFGDRFPFRYLVDDYGLAYFAAFSGCSAETEASFQTIVFLAQKVNELNLPAVLTIEGSNQKIAETIIQTTDSKDQKLMTLNSMQGITADDVRAGTSYLSIMESNLGILKEALN